MSFSAEYIYRILDRYSGPLKRISQSTSRFEEKTKRATAAVARMNSKLKGLRDVGREGFTKVTLPLAAIGVMAGKTAIDIQSGMIGVEKTVTASIETLNAMKEQFKEMSKEIPVSVNQLFKIGEAAGQLGIKTENIMSFTETMAKLGATTNIAGEEGAKQLARFSNIMGMNQKDFDRLGSSIAHLGNNLATSESEIVSMAKRLAAAGKRAGMTEAQVLGLAGAASSVGLEAEMGGTAISRIILEMNSATRKGGQKMRNFAKVAGMSSKEFAKTFKNDSLKTLIAFMGGLGDLEKQGADTTSIMERLGFSGVRVEDVLGRGMAALDKFKEAQDHANEAWKNNIYLTKEADLRFKSWGSQLIIVWNRIKLVSNEVGKILVPAFIALADIIVPVLEKFNGLSRTSKIVILSIAGIAAVIPPLLILIGSMAWAFGASAPFFAAMATGIGFLTTGLGAMAISAWAALAPILVMAAPFIAVAAAVGAVGAAIYQLVKHWDALTAPGFFKDLVGFTKMLGSGAIDKISGFFGGDEIGANTAQDKAHARAAQNNKLEVSGQIGVTAANGAKVESANINLNTGYNNLAAAH